MVIVDKFETERVKTQIEEDIAKEPTQEQIEEELIQTGEGTIVRKHEVFINNKGKKRWGFYLNEYLKHNLDNYLIKGVAKKWDGVVAITGMEGSAKSTNAFTIARYCDPTFPGQLLNDGTNRRTCDRIVFSTKDFMEQIDKATPGQAIVFDEAVMGFLAQDSATDLQKALVKKMVTIRKKRLFIFIVIPSIFLLRMYMAVFRTRALIHFYTPDGLSRGHFKFYSYDTKRKLFVKGKKEFDQSVQKADFVGSATDTEGYFIDVKEYDKKKDEAIKSLTEEPEKKKNEASDLRKLIKGQRDVLMYEMYCKMKNTDTKFTYDNFVDHLKVRYGWEFDSSNIGLILKNATKFMGLSNSVSVE